MRAPQLTRASAPGLLLELLPLQRLRSGRWLLAQVVEELHGVYRLLLVERCHVVPPPSAGNLLCRKRKQQASDIFYMLTRLNKYLASSGIYETQEIPCITSATPVCVLAFISQQCLPSDNNGRTVHNNTAHICIYIPCTYLVGVENHAKVRVVELSFEAETVVVLADLHRRGTLNVPLKY